MHTKILLIGAKGYCGAYLNEKIHGVIDTIDYRDGNPDYRSVNIPPNYYDVILWFAGLSSVASAQNNPDALDNNVLGLQRLAERHPKTYIVYASSASVYHGCESLNASETDLIYPHLNDYDRTKFAADYLLTQFHSNTLGLRMGTVCGFSNNMRTDTMFNAMNLSAINKKHVRVSNPFNRRTILFLDRLYEVVHTSIKHRPVGLLNVGSLNVSITELAEWVAQIYKVPLIRDPDSKSYSFWMNLNKMRDLLPSITEPSLEDRCQEFKRAFQSI